jgi:hypothetical protein
VWHPSRVDSSRHEVADDPPHIPRRPAHRRARTRTSGRADDGSQRDYFSKRRIRQCGLLPPCYSVISYLKQLPYSKLFQSPPASCGLGLSKLRGCWRPSGGDGEILLHRTRATSGPTWGFTPYPRTGFTVPYANDAGRPEGRGQRADTALLRTARLAAGSAAPRPAATARTGLRRCASCDSSNAPKSSVLA